MRDSPTTAPLAEAVISGAMSGAACARNGNRPGCVRTYIVDDVVLILTEHVGPSCDPRVVGAGPGDGHPGPGAGRDSPGRRAVVERVTGRDVMATLRGLLDDPRISFELFVLTPRDGAREH